MSPYPTVNMVTIMNHRELENEVVHVHVKSDDSVVTTYYEPQGISVVLGTIEPRVRVRVRVRVRARARARDRDRDRG